MAIPLSEKEKKKLEQLQRNFQKYKRVDISPKELKEKVKDMSIKERIQFMWNIKKLTRCAWCGKKLEGLRRKYCSIECRYHFYHFTNYTYKLNPETMEWEKNDG